MTQNDSGKAYNRIAEFRDGDRFKRQNGIEAHRKAMRMELEGGWALDIGCDCRRSFFDLLRESGYEPEGVDVSQGMVRRAKLRHPEIEIAWADFLGWESEKLYSLITSWGSIWHLNIEGQIQAIRKASGLLDSGGIFIFTAGAVEDPAEHSSPCMEQDPFYGALGEAKLLELLSDRDLRLRHFEFDQYPEKLLVLIVQKTNYAILPLVAYFTPSLESFGDASLAVSISSIAERALLRA